MTVAGLLDLLDHVKRRNNLLVALGLACLFAWWIKGATPDSEGPFGTLRHQQADWNASADLIALQVVKINEWASTHAPDRIWRARSQVNDVGMSLGSHGWRARWFVLSNEFGSFESAWQQVHAHPLALRQDTWTASSFKAFASLTLGYKMQPSEVRDMLAVRAEFSAAAVRPEEAALARTGLSALDQLIATFAELAWTMNPALAGAVSDAGQIAASMEKSGFQAYAPFARMVQAEQIRKELATGSLDVIGFSIPGVVVRLLLPVLLLIVSVDLLGTLRRAARPACSLTEQQVLAVLRGYPWLFTPSAFDGHGNLRRRHRMQASVVILAPIAAACPLVSLGPVNGYTLAGIIALTGAAVALLLSVAALAALRGKAASEPIVLESLSVKLASQHFKAGDSALGSLILACAAALPFFLAFLIVPAALQTNGPQLSTAATTRQTLEKVYQQRLLDQSQAYADWCRLACTIWTELSFAKSATPPEHPAYSILSDIVANPIVRNQGPAVANVEDLVTESRARFSDLDPEDVRDVLEVLYRDSFSSLQQQLGVLQRIIAKDPLPEGAADYLPDAVKKPPIENMTVPFVMPHRVMIEKGGFAYRLHALPTEAQIKGFLAEMAKLGVTSVEGFDRYQSEMALLETELGKVSLKVAGFAVPRAVARDLTLIIIALLATSLASRLKDCRRFVENLESVGEPPADISNVPGLLFLDTSSWPRRVRWLPEGIFIGAVLLTQALVLTSSEQSTLHPALPIIALVITAAALAWAMWERRAIVRATRVDIVGD